MKVTPKLDHAGKPPEAPLADIEAAPARLRWRCRRGMREMDILMLGWLEQHWPTASPAQRAAFEALIDELDQDILAWVLGREPTPPYYLELVECLGGLMSRGGHEHPASAP